MGQSNSKIKSSGGFKLLDRKRQNSSTDEIDQKDSSNNDETLVRDYVYTNADLFNHIASFLTAEELNSFADANKETKQAVYKFLSHWKCSRKYCGFQLFDESLGNNGLYPATTCGFCHGNLCCFCRDGCNNCSDCGLVSCEDCDVLSWCSAHEAFHCKDCNPTRYCECCQEGYCSDSEVDVQTCDECGLFSCADCTKFFICNVCSKMLCRACGFNNLNQCTDCALGTERDYFQY